MTFESIDLGEIIAVVFGGGGLLAIIVRGIISSVKEKRESRKYMWDEIKKLREENIKLKEQNAYHEKTIKRFIQIEMLKNPSNAESLKIWLDE